MSAISELAGLSAELAAPAGGPARIRTFARESWRYLAASVAALAVDFSLLVFLSEIVRLNYLWSAAVGFTAGLLVTYGLSVTLIFRERRFGRGFELGGFVLIGLLGLGLNELLLRGMVEGLGFGYALAKIPAAGVSFVFNFISRRVLLFTAPRRIEGAAGGV
ncbi:MAG TPA: GtrA family protein [Caulobacteraceae bacterium]